MLIYDSLSHKFDIKLENLYGPGKIMGSVDLGPPNRYAGYAILF